MSLGLELERTLGTQAGYDDLEEVADGTAAQRAYLEAIHPQATEPRKLDLERKLYRYCRTDTEAMIGVVRALIL